jgi:hypothetical protein
MLGQHRRTNCCNINSLDGRRQPPKTCGRRIFRAGVPASQPPAYLLAACNPARIACDALSIIAAENSMDIRCKRLAQVTALALCCSIGFRLDAKPIAFADGTTVMGEYGAGTMTELQAFYAPSFRYSIGGGHLSLNSSESDDTRDITYARLNYLPKRWNMEAAQANVFVWGSVGRAHIGETGDNALAWNVGGQLDYETRKLYASLRSDLHEASAYSHRIDTLQLGIAPYEHDYATLAVWFVVQARRYTGGLYDGTEGAALVRLFKRNAWIEAGVTQDGHLQAMLMFNF